MKTLTPVRPPSSQNFQEDKFWYFQNFIINSSSHEIITKNQIIIRLRKKEFELLQCLYFNPNRLINKQELLELVWNYDLYINTNTLEVHLCKLRNKLKKAGHKNLIETIHGAGYRFNF